MADVQNIVIKYTSDTSGITDAEKAYEALTIAEKQATDQVKKLEQQQTKLGKARKQVAELTAAHNRLAESIKKAQEANNAQAIKSTTLAYQALGKQLDTAKKKYSELLSKTKEAGNTTSELSGILKNMAQYAIGAFSISSVINFGKAVYDNTLKMEGLNKRLGMLGDAKTEFQYLVNLSNKFGLDLESTADAFSSFAIASTASGISLSETKQIFEGVSTAITALQLPAEQSSRVFYALQQMMSKGKVSAEELRQQLGEALPGSFALAIQASGKTEQEFNKLLETGQILAKDFVPKFAALLGSKYEGGLTSSLDSATAATNRLSTAWTLFKTSLGDSKTIKDVTNYLADSLTGLTALTNEYLNNPERIYMGIPGLIMSLKGAGDKLKAEFSKARDAMAKEEMERSDARVSKKLADERIRVEKEKGKSLKQINEEAIKNEKIYADAIIEEQNNLLNAKTQNEAKNSALAIKRYETAIAIEKNIVQATTEKIKAQQKALEEQKKIEQEKRKIANETFMKEFQMELEILEARKREQNGVVDYDKFVMKTKIQHKIKEAGDLATIDQAYYAGLNYLQEEQNKKNKTDAEENIELHKQAMEMQKQLLQESALQSVAFIGQLFSFASEKEIATIEELNKRKVISDTEAERRIRDIKRKAFIANKIAAVSEIAINTAIAISKVTGQTGVGAPFIIPLLIAQGAIQTATVLAQPIPFAKGTKSVPDKYGKPNQDSVPAMLTPGEKVFPVHTSTLYNDGLNAIFDHKVSPDVVNALGKGELKQQVVVINDNKDVIKAIREKETMIIEDKALLNAIIFENKGMISRNKRRFKR